MKHQKSSDFSKIIVCIVVLINIIFTGSIIVLFWHTGSEPAVLIGGWFAFTGTELWNLATIKKKKLERVKEDESDSDY